VGKEISEESDGFRPNKIEVILVLTTLLGSGTGVLIAVIGAITQSTPVTYLGLVVLFIAVVPVPIIFFTYERIIKKIKIKKKRKAKKRT